MGNSRFVLAPVDDQVPKPFVLAQSNLSIGRGTENDIMLSHPSVSRIHARFAVGDESVRVEDMASRNGIAVNGRRTLMSELRAGDVVTIGEVSFTVELEGQGGGAMQRLSAKDVAQVTASAESALQKASYGYLYALAQTLTYASEPHRCAEKLLGVLLPLCNAKRGFVFWRADEQGIPEVVASALTDGASSTPEPDRAAIDSVIETMEARLLAPSSEGQEADPSSPVVCAPVIFGDRVFGVLYLDQGLTTDAFEGNHLERVAIAGRILGGGLARGFEVAARGERASG